MTTDLTTRETIAPDMSTGLTEVVMVIGAVSALLTMLFGQDFGVSRVGVQAAPHVLVIVLALLAGYRAVKRVSINHANTTVTKAAISAAATAGVVPGDPLAPVDPPPADVAPPVSVVAGQASDI